jgi:hypothetical protein
MDKRNKERPQGDAGERQLLYGLARCGSCKRLLVRETTEHHSRYRCTGKARQQNPCKAPVAVREHILDPFVLAKIEPLLDLPAITMNRESDPVALQRRLLLDAEVTLLSTSMGTIAPSEVTEAAVRLTALMEERDAVEIKEVITKTASDQSLRDWYEDDPRRVLAMMIEQVRVVSGYGTIKERTEIVWHESLQDFDE